MEGGRGAVEEGPEGEAAEEERDEEEKPSL